MRAPTPENQRSTFQSKAQDETFDRDGTISLVPSEQRAAPDLTYSDCEDESPPFATEIQQLKKPENLTEARNLVLTLSQDQVVNFQASCPKMCVPALVLNAVNMLVGCGPLDPTYLQKVATRQRAEIGAKELAMVENIFKQPGFDFDKLKD